MTTLSKIESSNESITGNLTPLHRMMNAISGHDTAAVAALLAEGEVDVNRGYQNDLSGDIGTPLVFAVERGYNDIVKLLLDAGADVELSPTRRTTPLIFAAYAKHAETVKILLAAGADVDAEEIGGGTALSNAEERGATDVADILREAIARKRHEESTTQMQATASTRQEQLRARAPHLRLKGPAP